MKKYWRKATVLYLRNKIGEWDMYRFFNFIVRITQERWNGTPVDMSTVCNLPRLKNINNPRPYGRGFLRLRLWRVWICSIHPRAYKRGFLEQVQILVNKDNYSKCLIYWFVKVLHRELLTGRMSSRLSWDTGLCCVTNPLPYRTHVSFLIMETQGICLDTVVI